MIVSSSLISLALAYSALAIPPPDFGFPEAPNDTALTVRFQDGKVLVKEAALYGINVPESPPMLSVNTNEYRSLADYNGSYTVLMVDPDAPYPQDPSSRFILHWMQPNLTQSNNTSSSGRMLENTTAPAVPYLRPSPPTNSSAHRYIIYAFVQPSNFTIPQQYAGLSAMNRTNFNLTGFLSEAGLDTPAAAEYFYVSNQTQVPATFTAAPGGSYPSGNGQAITSGDPYSASATAAATMGSGSSGSSSSSSAGAAMITGVGGLLGAGLVGVAAIL